MTSGRIDPEALQQPLYSYAEADYFAGTSRGTAKRWLAGYHYRKSGEPRVGRPPVTRDSGREEGGVSFLDLVEVVAIGGLKRSGFTLQEVRELVENTQELLEVKRPLVTVEFKIGGHEIFAEEHASLVRVLHGRGQRAWEEVLAPFLESLDYSNDMVRRWWPLGKAGRVCLDPEYAFGLPIIFGSGIRTEIILERFEAGEEREEVAQDFNISPSDVDSALRFEVNRATARAA